MSDTPETGALDMAPGQMLKRAREGKNLTVAAIATLMNLDLRTIEALERDEQDKLPAPIFVRGYLRGYARLVGVTEESILEAYKVHAPQDPLPRSVGMSRVPMRPAFRAQMIPWKGVFAVLFVMLLVWVGMQWWPEIDARLRGDETQTAELATEADAVHADQTTTESATDNVTALLPDLLETEETIDTGDAAIELALPAPQPSMLTEPLPALAEPEGLPNDTDFAATEAQSEAEAPSAATAMGPGDVRVEFKVKGDSWVEVRAADGKSLLLGLLRKGDSRSVTGKAPLSVVLGNAAGVDIQVNGEVFEHRRYTNNNIARFEIKR